MPMPNSPVMPAVQVRTVTPCVCCRERPHAGIPDADLEGYVCRACAKHLRAAEAALAADGILGCRPEPK